MTKVIILAYDFPPYVSVGGLRPYAWFKYLKKFDVYPIVITRQWQNKYGNELDYISEGNSNTIIHEKFENGEIIRTPYKPNLSNKLLLKYGPNRFKWIRKFISAYFEFFKFLIPVGPQKNIYFGAKEYLKKNKVDLIIASGSPFILFKYAYRLSEKNKTPWIADYRDPWSQNISYQNLHLFKKWNQIFEKKALKKVYSIITVSQFVADKIKANCPNKKISIIPNGFDYDVVKKINNQNQNSDVLTLSYAGSIYNWHPVKILFSTLEELLLNSAQFKLNLYGVNNPNEIEIILSKFPNLKLNTQIVGKLSNEEVLTNLAKSNALILFNDYSIMGTKIYDYIGIKRKIIFCFTNDQEAKLLKEKYFSIDEKNSPNNKMQSQLINSSDSGILVTNKIHLKEVMYSLINEFNERKKINCNSRNIDEFSREKLVNQLAKLIQQIIKKEKVV